jgi:transcriptional regulator with XRE-family HTH domain
MGSAVDDETYLRYLGDRLRLCRLALRMSQQDLADAAGLSRVFVSAVERGRHGANVLALRHLAAALRMTLCDLVSEEGADGPRPTPDPDRPG